MKIDSPVLVTGATSLVGGFLLARLAADGCDAAALSRRPPPNEPRWIEADLSWPDLEAALPFAHTVFALSPIWSLPQALHALKARGMTRLVAFSSTSRFTKEHSPDADERETARNLADGEALTIGFCEANDVAWTILRPTLIYAEGRDGNVSRLAGLIRKLGGCASRCTPTIWPPPRSPQPTNPPRATAPTISRGPRP